MENVYHTNIYFKIKYELFKFNLYDYYSFCPKKAKSYLPFHLLYWFSFQGVCDYLY